MVICSKLCMYSLLHFHVQYVVLNCLMKTIIAK